MSDLTVPITTVPVASECTMQDLISLMYRLVDTINRQAVAIEVLEGRLSEVSHSVRTLRSYQQAQETTTTTTTTSQGPTSPLHHQQQQQHSAQQYNNTHQPIDEDNSIFTPPRQRGGDPLPNAQQQHHHHQQSTFQPTPWSPPRGSTMIPHSNNTTTMNPSSATAGMPPPTSPQRFRTYTITSTVAAYPSEPVRQHIGFPAPPMPSSNNNNTGAGWRAPRAASPRKTNFAPDGCGPSPGVPGLQGGSSSRQGSATRGGV
eukprot:PhF_6_TR30865/c0_g1_i2/m.45420